MKASKYALALSCLGLVVCLSPSAKADSADIENLVFTGTATCIDTSCASLGNGPLTGTYSVDVDTQTIVGPWSFSTPFGLISSSDSGASAGVFNFSGDVEAAFSVSSANFFDFVHLWFPGTNTQEIGVLAFDIRSDGCINLPGSGGACDPDYTITGTTALATPEPTSLMLLGAGLVGLMGMGLYKRQ